MFELHSCIPPCRHEEHRWIERDSCLTELRSNWNMNQHLQLQHILFRWSTRLFVASQLPYCYRMSQKPSPTPTTSSTSGSVLLVVQCIVVVVGLLSFVFSGHVAAKHFFSLLDRWPTFLERPSFQKYFFKLCSAKSFCTLVLGPVVPWVWISEVKWMSWISVKSLTWQIKINRLLVLKRNVMFLIVLWPGSLCCVVLKPGTSLHTVKAEHQHFNLILIIFLQINSAGTTETLPAAHMHSKA